MSILITGGAGFIGTHLTKYLLKNKESIIILDDFSSAARYSEFVSNKKSGLEIVSGSILDKKIVKSLMNRVDRCFHLAARVGVQRINQDPIGSLNVNLKGSEIVLEAASNNGVRILLASSSEVYGKNTSVPLNEESDRILGAPQVMRWSYSEAKAIDELYAFEFHKSHSLRFTIARLFNTVGPGQSGVYGMVLPRFVQAALKNQSLIVYGDGTQCRTFCSVTDAVEGLSLLLNSEESIGHAFNVGSSNEITIYDLAVKVINLTKSNSKILYKEFSEVYGDRFEETHRRVPDISKMKRFNGWSPKIDLDTIILEIADYLRSNAI